MRHGQLGEIQLCENFRREQSQIKCRPAVGARPVSRTVLDDPTLFPTMHNEFK